MDAQFVVERALAEVEEVDDGRRLLEHPRVFLRGLQQQLAHQVEVRTITDTHLEGDAGDRVGQRPVDQLTGDEGLVRNDDFLVIEIGHGGGADTDLAHRAGEIADSDHVTDAHRALEQDDQAGNEVGEDLLQTETQAHRQRRHQPLQFVPAYAKGGQRADDADSDQCIGQQGRGGVGAALCQAHARQHQHFEQARQVARQRHRDGDDDQRADHVHQADRHQGRVIPGATAVFVEVDGVEVGEHADQIGPDRVQADQETAEQGQADQAQGLLVDLLDIQGRLFQRCFAVQAFLALCLAFGQGALVGQAPCRHAQTAYQGGLDDQQDDQQVEGVDQPVGELERGVVIAEGDRADQCQWQQVEQHAEGGAQPRSVLAQWCVEQQVEQQPGHQGVAGDHHDDADHIACQARRLVLGDAHHGHQGHHHQTQAT